jgi:hypothetical protein
LSFEKDKRTRIEAADILSGDAVWQSEKLKGAIMQMAVDIDNNLLAVVLARDAKGKSGSGLKRKPIVLEAGAGQRNRNDALELERERRRRIHAR